MVVIVLADVMGVGLHGEDHGAVDRAEETEEEEAVPFNGATIEKEAREGVTVDDEREDGGREVVAEGDDRTEGCRPPPTGGAAAVVKEREEALVANGLTGLTLAGAIPEAE